MIYRIGYICPTLSDNTPYLQAVEIQGREDIFSQNLPFWGWRDTSKG